MNRKISCYTFLLCLFSSSFVFSMQKEKLSLDSVAPLFFSTIKNNNFDCFEKYLEQYPELVHYNDQDNEKALNYAYKREQYDFVISLLEHGCCINTFDENKSLLRECIRYPGPDYDFTKILLSSGALCNTVCKHNRDLPHTKKMNVKSALDDTYDRMCDKKKWEQGMPLILMSSDTRALFLERYNKAKSIQSAQLPIESFMHGVILGFCSDSMSPEKFQYLFTCPAFAQDLKFLLLDVPLKKLAEFLSVQCFENALITQNKIGLMALLQMTSQLDDEIMSLLQTKNITENFSKALDNHKKIWPRFVKEIEEVGAIVYKKQLQARAFYMNKNNLQNIQFKFQ